MSRIGRSLPPAGFDENPEWTVETDRRSRRGGPWMWADDTVSVLRTAAKALRTEADALEAEADRIEATGK